MSGRRSLLEWLGWIEHQHPTSIDMGLTRVREVAGRMVLGRPARHVITIAGTNGKGSTVAFVEAIARAAGWKVGAYTSPHLLDYNERVRIDGHDVADQRLVEAFESIEAARKDVTLTYFEYGTLAALWLFERSELDLAILEVGLGGRLDATNLIDPDVAVITTVDLDHQAYLGDDRESIGAEKAGIARAWKPLVLGEDDPPSSVLGHAYAIGASAVRVGCDFFFEPLPADAESDDASALTTAGVAGERGTWRWHEVGFDLVLPVPRLAAPSQLRNAATAIAALRALDVDIPASAYAEGIASAHVDGRLQAFSLEGVEVIVDVAHNPQAARELAGWLQATPIPGRSTAVFAALGDKDLVTIASALEPWIDQWHLAGLTQAGSRGLDVEAFAGRLAGTSAGEGMRHADVAAALRAARAEAQAGDRILVFGSFHTVSAALGLLRARSASDRV